MHQAAQVLQPNIFLIHNDDSFLNGLLLYPEPLKGNSQAWRDDVSRPPSCLVLL